MLVYHIVWIINNKVTSSGKHNEVSNTSVWPGDVSARYFITACYQSVCSHVIFWCHARKFISLCNDISPLLTICLKGLTTQWTEPLTKTNQWIYWDYDTARPHYNTPCPFVYWDYNTARPRYNTPCPFVIENGKFVVGQRHFDSHINFEHGNGLVPSGNKPLPYPMLTLYLCRHMASLGHNDITAVPTKLPTHPS